MEHESFFEKQLWQFWVDLINNYVLLSTEVLIERTRREVKLFISTLVGTKLICLIKVLKRILVPYPTIL
ncbi:hypothetical protein Plhal304r1_c028g0093021 [Plasmopara halstedii]